MDKHNKMQSDVQGDESLQDTPASMGNIVQAKGDMKIPAHQSAQGARYDTPIIPEVHPSYNISNSGPADTVKAVFYWSHSFTSKWFEYDSVTVHRGETEKLKSPSNSLYYSKVVVFNDTEKLAYVKVVSTR